MSRLILPLIALLFCWSITIQAQVTIDQNTFPRQAAFVDSVAIDLLVEQLPTEGPDQFWDFSALQIDDGFTATYQDATADSDLPGALHFRSRFLSFQGLPIPRVTYAGVDESGFYDLGAATSDVIYPIGAISGGPNDSLKFVGKKAAFEGRLDFLQFPVTYEKEWTGSNIERINMELTIAAFGLNKTPGQFKRQETQHREVVGYGQLVIPQADGTPSAPTDALLIKVEESYVDSFFIAGAPAPLPLLNAFGLTQGVGIITPSTRYLFYRPGFGSPILAIGFEKEQGIVFIEFRPQGTEMTTSIEEIRWAALKSFPNPVQAGRNIVIQTKNPAPIGYFKLSDLNGRVVYTQSFEAASNRQFSIQIPVNTSSGLYFYHVFGRDSEPIGRGKLHVN